MSQVNLVVVEYMPECWRSSHHAAGNWGAYPHNGAERIVMSSEDADEACEGDEYNHIVRPLRDAESADDFGGVRDYIPD